MPIYEYECYSCEENISQYRKVEERHGVSCDKCDSPMKLLISKGGKAIVYNEYSDTIGSFITGPAQLSKVLKEKGLELADRSHFVNAKATMRGLAMSK
jgi:putative FmdB family regulatory protein